MEKALNDYLGKIEAYLKPMDASERIDIVKEIKSEILELQHSGTPTEDILNRLGNPRELAKAYLGESISKTTSFSWHKVTQVIAFYSLVGIGGLFVLPVTSILAIGLLLSAVIVPAAGVVKLIGYFLGFEVPYIMFQFGSYTLHPLLTFLLSIIMGLLFFLAGKGMWKLTVLYIRAISKRKERIRQ